MVTILHVFRLHKIYLIAQFCLYALVRQLLHNVWEAFSHLKPPNLYSCFLHIGMRKQSPIPPFLPFDVQGQSSRGGGHGGLRDVGFSGAESCSSLSNAQEVQIRL